VFDEFLREKAKATKMATITKYNSTKKSMIGFEKDYHPLSFDNMTMKFYLDYKIYSVEKLKHLNNTIAKNLRNIKTFLAVVEIHPKKYVTSTDYKRFKGENDDPEPLYLNESELEKFKNFDAGVSTSQHTGKSIILVAG